MEGAGFETGFSVPKARALPPPKLRGWFHPLFMSFYGIFRARHEVSHFCSTRWITGCIYFVYDIMNGLSKNLHFNSPEYLFSNDWYSGGVGAVGRTFIFTPTCNTQFQMYFGTNFQPRPKKFEKNFVFQCHRSIEAQLISVANTCICYRIQLSFNGPVTLEDEIFFNFFWSGLKICTKIHLKLSVASGGGNKSTA